MPDDIADLLLAMNGRLRAVATSLARTFRVDADWKEDLIQCGRIAVWQNAAGYTPERGDLKAYLTRCARNAMFSEFRRARGRDGGGRIRKPLVQSPEWLAKQKARHGPHDPVSDLREYTEALPPDQAEFVEARFVRDEILEEVGRARGLSKGWAFLEERRILGKLRGGLESR